MQFHARLRAALRVRHDRTAISVPAGILPLSVAMLVLIAVPLARAAGDDPSSADESASSGGSPVASEAASTPQLDARVIRARALGGKSVRIAGKVRGTGRGDAVVKLSVRAQGTRSWHVVRSKHVSSGERFGLRWRGERPGRYLTRVSVRKAGRVDVEHTGRVYVFRRSFASYYGPGLYGGGLACGGRLSPNTIGVAHKTLPCGTKVSFTLGNGRTVTTRVIDRGPFIAGRDWDLTAGLKRKLGFGSTGPVYATH
jgi:hypothetical protein